MLMVAPISVDVSHRCSAAVTSAPLAREDVSKRSLPRTAYMVRASLTCEMTPLAMPRDLREGSVLCM